MMVDFGWRGIENRGVAYYTLAYDKSRIDAVYPGTRLEIDGKCSHNGEEAVSVGLHIGVYVCFYYESARPIMQRHINASSVHPSAFCACRVCFA